MTNNDVAWDKIFGALNVNDSIQKHSFFQISSKQINDIGGREARLMAKFDTKESLPQLFKDSELNINAVSNGNYIIFKDPNYQSFIKLPDYNTVTSKKISPELDFKLQTLLFNPRMSESNAIDFAHHSKILSIYSGEKDLKLTTRGRFFSDAFDFNLGKLGKIDVKGVQIEVDAGYEGIDQFLIIEAKSSTRSSFNIRQLYYPYRHFQNKTSKRIRTILLSFSNGIYYFTEIELTPNYYDYKIIGNNGFEVEIKEKFEKPTLKELLSQEAFTPKDVTAPQADDLNKVIDLTTFLSTDNSDKFGIADYFEFDERQGDYYANAGRYIGLIEKENNLFKISNSGKELISIKNREHRNLFLIKKILSTQLFKDLLNLYFEQGEKIDDLQIVKRLAQDGLSGTTPERRKSTIKSWLNWIIDNLKN